MFGVGARNNVHKVAVLLTLLGREAAQEILRQLDPGMTERVGREMMRCDEISKGEGEKVLREFVQELGKVDLVAQGGIKFVKDVVTPVMGSERVERMLKEVQGARQIVLFQGLPEVEPEKLIAVLQSEHPQAIALVLANLPSDLSAKVMGRLPETKQTEVARRLAVLDKNQLDLEMAREIETRLLDRLKAEEDRGQLAKIGGIQTCADILNQMDKGAVRRILEELEGKNPPLAEEIKVKLVRFEDIVKLDDLEVQRVLKEVETQDLATACIKTPKEVEDKIFHNMSQRGAEMLKDDIEVMRNVKPEAIRAARLKIAESLRRLDEEGVVTLNKGSLDNELV
jgi:flagellar motor switch protein FliG